jgi:tyrosine-protein kinase Etk/Wzc
MKDQFDFYEDEQEKNGFQNFAKYLRYWKWFVLSVLLSLSVCLLRLRYISPEYKAVAKIVVRDEKKGGLASELGAFADMGLLTGMKNNVDNEVEILNSITLTEKAAERLKFTTTYFRLGKIRDVELYKTTQPFEFAIENASQIFYKTPQTFKVKVLSNSRFQLLGVNNLVLGDFNFGVSIALKEAKIKIQKLPNFNTLNPINATYAIYCNSVKTVGAEYLKRLTVEALSKTSSVVNLSISDKVPEKAEDFLDALVAIYNEEAIKDKNTISENTLEFIQDRLGVITTELGNVEQQSENFKRTNEITDISVNAGIYLKSHSEFETNLIETETQLRILSIMIDFMKNKGKSELVPIDIIPKATAGQPTPLLVEYNQLVLQRNRILKDGTSKNYVVTNLDQQLEELDRNIKESLAQLKSSLVAKRTNLEKQDDVLQGKISNIPNQEREFRIFDRQQKIKEGVYLYLIQKREETAISLSVKETNAKIIDAGRAEIDPIAPKKSVWYLVTLLAGLGIPFGILSIIFLLDNKIHNGSDVESTSNVIPILGELPVLLDTNDSAMQSLEAFRTLANNTNFITPVSENEEGRAIFVTSSIKGEGKTFVSYNLANAYAQLDKKVIILGCDFRNPQLHKYMDISRKAKKGTSNFLHDTSLQWQDLIYKTYDEEFPFDILTSGDIPPNPTLLLSNKRFTLLIDELKKHYDIVILDTPPTLLVTDSLIISKCADTTVYVVRSGVTEKNLISYSNKLSADKKVVNMGYVVNGIDFTCSYGYGYGYGYGYNYNYNYGYGYGYGKDAIKQPWYKKITKLLKGKK